MADQEPAPAGQQQSLRIPKVSALSSLAAKLFLLMTALVLITIAGNSFQYIRAFMDYQAQQVQDSLQLTAERAAGQVESAVDSWRSQIAVALPTLKGNEDDASHDQVRKFVDSSHEFVGFMMLGAASSTSTVFTKNGEAFTSNVADPRFEDKVPARVWEVVRASAQKWLRRDVPRLRGGNNVIVESFAKTLGLPIMMTAVRFEVTGSKAVMWAVLATWQSNLLKALPKSKLIEGAVVDRKGKVFTSPNIGDMLKRAKFPANRLLKDALAATSPAGFAPEYRTDGNKRRLGAFARLPKYGLTVLIESDAELAYQAVKRNLFSTALWASLFLLLAVMFSYFGSQQITKNLRAVTLATERIASGDFRHQIRPTTRDEIAQLAVAVNHMSQRIVGLLRTQVEKARIAQELETAKLVQGTFFPRANIRRGPLFVTGFYQPATECGGDLWGHFTIKPGVEFLFVADAMGHGAPAAMVTAMAYATTMTLADIMRDEPELGTSPASVLARVNRILFEAVRGSISMTAFAAVIDSRSGVITFSNAGHNFPFIIPATASDDRSGKANAARAKKTGKPQAISLKQMGTPLGMGADTAFKDSLFEMRAGDKLFLFTDGLIECTAPSGEAWGRKHLLDQAADTAALDAEAMRDELLSRAFAFFANKPLDDDVTVVIIEVDKTWTKSTEPAPLLVEATSAEVGASMPGLPKAVGGPAVAAFRRPADEAAPPKLPAPPATIPPMSMPPMSMPPMSMQPMSMPPMSMPPMSMPPISMPPASMPQRPFSEAPSSAAHPDLSQALESLHPQSPAQRPFVPPPTISARAAAPQAGASQGFASQSAPQAPGPQIAPKEAAPRVAAPQPAPQALSQPAAPQAPSQLAAAPQPAPQALNQPAAPQAPSQLAAAPQPAPQALNQPAALQAPSQLAAAPQPAPQAPSQLAAAPQPAPQAPGQQAAAPRAVAPSQTQATQTRPVAGVSSALAQPVRPIPTSPTSSPAATPLGKAGKYKIKLPGTG